MHPQLVYAVPADLGSAAAHCVHVLKMGDALQKTGLTVEVCVRAAPDRADLVRRFGLQTQFDVIRVPMRGMGPVSLKFARGVMSYTPNTARVLTRNIVTAVLSTLYGRRTVLELHSPVESLREKFLLRTFLKSRNAVGLVVVTEALKDRFLQDVGSRYAPILHVLPDAAEAIPFPNIEETKGNTVGYIGSFLPGKGAELVVEIAKLMPDVRFILVGGPKENLNLESLPENISIAGQMAHSETLQMLWMFDVALLPNQPSVLVSNGKVDIGKWTSPLKLFEYMAARRPIVASRLTVLQEVLSDHRNALLANPTDPADWVNCIRKLLADRDLAERIAKTAHQNFLDHYTWDQRARRMASILGFEK